MNKKYFLIILLIGLAISINYIFNNDSLNVINPSVEEQVAANYTGKEIFDNFDNALAKPNKSFFTAMEFEREMYKNLELNLTKNVYANMGIVLSGKRVIKSDELNRAKIIAKDNSVMFYSNNADVIFENIDFFIVNTAFFLNEVENSKSSVTFKNCRFFLEQKSSLDIRVKTLEISNSLVVSTAAKSPDSGLLLLKDISSVKLKNNFFIDVSQNLIFGVSIFKSENVIVEGNIFISYLKDLRAPLMVEEIKNLIVKDNLLSDLNSSFREIAISHENKPDSTIINEYLKGTIGISYNKIENFDIQENYNYADNYLYPTSKTLKPTNLKESSEINFKKLVNENLSINCEEIKKLPTTFKEKISKQSIWGIKDLNSCI